MADEFKKGAGSADLIEGINEEFDTFEGWVSENWRYVVAGFIALVVLMAAGGIAFAIHKSMQRKTAQQFASAETAEKLVAALAAHPSAAAAPDARMKLAMLQVEKKDYASALASFKEIFDSKKASDSLRFRAALNTACVYELQGKLDDAVASFSSVGQNMLAPDDVRFEANYSAGRILAGKKDFDKARSFLSKATSVRPRSMGEYFWSTQAKFLLDRLPAAAQQAPAAPAPKSKG